MTRDALSAALDVVEARAEYVGGLVAGGDWAIRFPPPHAIKFFALGRGTCMFARDGHEPICLAEGDVLLLTERISFVIASDLSLCPVEATEVFADRTSPMASVGSGEDMVFLGCHLTMETAGGRMLVENLPPLIHLKAADTPTDRLHWLIREFVHEARSDLPGADMACGNLAHLIFLQLLRGFLTQKNGVDVGWLRAACDPRLAPALRLMHGDPARAWSLAELALSAAMSRTAFATHFKATAGVPPLAYLTEWRMRLAERRLRENGQTVATIARSVGYESEAAFSTAFKRVMGRSPRRARMPG